MYPRLARSWRLAGLIVIPLILLGAGCVADLTAKQALILSAFALLLTTLLIAIRIRSLSTAVGAMAEQAGTPAAAVQIDAEMALARLESRVSRSADDAARVATFIQQRLEDVDRLQSASNLFSLLEKQQRAISRLENELDALRKASPPSPAVVGAGDDPKAGAAPQGGPKAKSPR